MESTLQKINLFYPTNAEHYQRLITNRWSNAFTDAGKAKKEVHEFEIERNALVRLIADFISTIETEAKYLLLDNPRELVRIIEETQKNITQVRGIGKIDRKGRKVSEIEYIGNPMYVAIANFIESSVKQFAASGGEKVTPNIAEVTRLQKSIQDGIGELVDFYVSDDLKKLQTPAAKTAEEKLKANWEKTEKQLQNIKIVETSLQQFLTKLSKCLPVVNSATIKSRNKTQKYIEFRKSKKEDAIVTLDIDLDALSEGKATAVRQLKDQIIKMINTLYLGQGGLINILKGDDFEIVVAEAAKVLQNEAGPYAAELLMSKLKGVTKESVGSTEAAKRADVNIEYDIGTDPLIQGISIKNVQSPEIASGTSSSYYTIFEDNIKFQEKSDPTQWAHYQARRQRIDDNIRSVIKDQAKAKEIAEDQRLNELMSLVVVQGSAYKALTDDSSFAGIENKIKQLWALQNARMIFGLDVSSLIVTSPQATSEQAKAYNQLELLLSTMINWIKVRGQLSVSEKGDLFSVEVTSKIDPNQKLKIDNVTHSVKGIWSDWREAVKDSNIFHDPLGEQTKKYIMFDNYIKDRTKLSFMVREYGLVNERTKGEKLPISDERFKALLTEFKAYETKKKQLFDDIKKLGDKMKPSEANNLITRTEQLNKSALKVVVELKNIMNIFAKIDYK